MFYRRNGLDTNVKSFFLFWLDEEPHRSLRKEIRLYWEESYIQIFGDTVDEGLTHQHPLHL